MKYLFIPLFIVGLLTFAWYRFANHYNITGDLSKIKQPLVVFDFDGTICPSYPLFIDQMKLLLNLEIDGEPLRGLHAKEIMKKMGISKLRLPFLLHKARRNVQKELVSLPPVAGIAEQIRALKQAGASLGILTSNSQENVRLYCERHGLDCFDFIYTSSNVFGKAKHLNAIASKTGCKNFVYVGDEVRDIEAAKEAHIQIIAVTWGYNSKKLLEEAKPNILCEIPTDIIMPIDIIPAH